MATNQAMRNANDGVAVLQTAESSYQNISDLLIRMGARGPGQRQHLRYGRGYINTEFSDLSSEIDRVASVTEYNGINLLTLRAVHGLSGRHPKFG